MGTLRALRRMLREPSSPQLEATLTAQGILRVPSFFHLPRKISALGVTGSPSGGVCPPDQQEGKGSNPNQRQAEGEHEKLRAFGRPRPRRLLLSATTPICHDAASRGVMRLLGLRQREVQKHVNRKAKAPEYSVACSSASEVESKVLVFVLCA